MIPEKLVDWVGEIISQCGFELKKEKQLTMKKDRAQFVTGLNVNRKKPTIPRKVKRVIRRESHVFEKYEADGLNEAERYRRAQKIQGKVAYLNYIKRKESED